MNICAKKKPLLRHRNICAKKKPILRHKKPYAFFFRFSGPLPLIIVIFFQKSKTKVRRDVGGIMKEGKYIPSQFTIFSIR
jgi:hypothetical protein